MYKVGINEEEVLLRFILRIKLTNYGHLKRRRKIGWNGSIIRWTDGGLEVAGDVARRHQRPKCGQGYTSSSSTCDDLYMEETRIITITIGYDDPFNLYCAYSEFMFVGVFVT